MIFESLEFSALRIGQVVSSSTTACRETVNRSSFSLSCKDHEGSREIGCVVIAWRFHLFVSLFLCNRIAPFRFKNIPRFADVPRAPLFTRPGEREGGSKHFATDLNSWPCGKKRAYRRRERPRTHEANIDQAGRSRHR